MGTTMKTRRRQQSAKLQPFKLRGTAAKLLALYSSLTESGRRSFEDLLLQHAFLLNGLNPYVAWGKWNEQDRRMSYFHLASISGDVADAWYDWAFEISVEYTCRNCHEAILNLIGELVVLRLLDKPFP